MFPVSSIASPAQIPSPRAEVRRLLGLAWPVMLTSLNWTLLHVTDVVMVGMAGTREVAALGASRSLTFVGIVVVLGWLSGVLVFASRADGARDLPATGRVLHEGLVAAVLLGLASGGILFAFAAPLLRLLGVAPDLVPAAAAVVRTMAFAYPFQLLSIAAGFFLEGISRPRRVAAVNLGLLPINALLAWALVAGHLGLPALGAVGAALATAIASAIGAVALLLGVLGLPDAAVRHVGRWRGAAAPSWQGVRALLGFGLVPAVASGLELVGFAVLIGLSTQLGGAAAHAFQIVFSIHNVTFAIALGLGSAAGVRAGNAVGQGLPRRAVARGVLAAGLGAGATGLLALGLLGSAGWITGLFPATDEVHRLAAAMLLCWAPFILFDGVQVVLVYALRALGDQVVAGGNSIVAFFVVTGGVGWLLVGAGVGPLALAWASGIGMVVAALLHAARLAWLARRMG
ncbi:MATE family efflux transporter [Sphingomonas sp. ac-8]|uniref:MATE family efflux transporter n=1 Tax=Sphingomonas sp. ac-8 TaxID=3242977 RepID=UPI003A7FB3DD